MEFVVKFEFNASNNKAEYEALVRGMRMAQDAGASHLLAYSDSQLIVKQINGEYKAKEESMLQYLQQIKELKTKFKSFQLHQIPREENINADSLSQIQNTAYHYATSASTMNPTRYPAHFIKQQ
ncbi:UNVERIFIED_CONTAM: Ribonuclease HI [Sesamum radiatum]|uniref:Ribonuclease HI n=1 Tax=Sesamum radiatum TaxID=300843 RepID=A0AAW2VP96_SESRA